MKQVIFQRGGQQFEARLGHSGTKNIRLAWPEGAVPPAFAAEVKRWAKRPGMMTVKLPLTGPHAVTVVRIEEVEADEGEGAAPAAPVIKSPGRKPAKPVTFPITRSTRTTQPLDHGPARTVTIEHEPFLATCYDFYIPVAVWYHTATKLFTGRISQLAGGATIFKGATGVWKREPAPEKPEGADPGVDEEDIYIYRLIVRASEFNASGSRSGLHTEVANLMSALSEWDESRQQTVLFTEAEILMDLSRLIMPASAVAKAPVRVLL